MGLIVDWTLLKKRINELEFKDRPITFTHTEAPRKNNARRKRKKRKEEKS